jgi:hypothetical protein
MRRRLGDLGERGAGPDLVEPASGVRRRPAWCGVRVVRAAPGTGTATRSPLPATTAPRSPRQNIGKWPRPRLPAPGRGPGAPGHAQRPAPPPPPPPPPPAASRQQLLQLAARSFPPPPPRPPPRSQTDPPEIADRRSSQITDHRSQDQLRDHTGKKRRYWLVIKEIIRAAPCFFPACDGMVLVNNTSARKFSRREVGGPAQRLQAAVEQLTGEHSTPTLDFFRATSAGECLVVSTVSLQSAARLRQ